MLEAHPSGQPRQTLLTYSVNVFSFATSVLSVCSGNHAEYHTRIPPNGIHTRGMPNGIRPVDFLIW